MSGPWKILVQSGGHVSFLTNLSEDDARRISQKVSPGSNPWTQDRLEREAGYFNPSRLQSLQNMGLAGLAVYPGYAGNAQPVQTHIDWWGPEGEMLEIWPKPADWDARVESAKAAARLVEETNRKIAAATP